MTERLQRFLAHAGIASRRKAEELIVAGRVSVNGERVDRLGTQIDPSNDLVTLDGKPVDRPETEATYILYKPSGCVTTLSDPEGRPTVADYLGGVKERVFPVGRLDYDAEGAVLLTTDGELANRLSHPRYGHQRVYLVKVKGVPEPEALKQLVAGVQLDDGPARALECGIHERTERNTWIRMVVGEGRNHLVKRLCAAVGLAVQRLFRPEFGGITVHRLRPGNYRLLIAEEVAALKNRVGLGRHGAAAVHHGPDEWLVLPKAARRHGHGPPPVKTLPGSKVPPGGRAHPGGETTPDDEMPPGGRAPPGGKASPGRKPVLGRKHSTAKR